MGVKCPTKLFYKAQNFPENEQSIPFIKHAVFNKRLLKSLAQSVYPVGKYIEGSSVSESAALTSKYLEQDRIVLFDAIFEYQKMMARLPIVEKNGDKLTVFHIQAKVFDSRKHRLVNNQGELYPKWRDYLLDFAYQLFILKQNFPVFELEPILVLPEKKGLSHSDKLPLLLNDADRNALPQIPQENQLLLSKVEVESYISMIWEDPDFAKEHLPKSSFSESLEFLRQTYFNQTKIPAEIGLKCKSCEFRIKEDRKNEGMISGFDQCWHPYQTGKNHVFDLIGPGTNRWIEEGVYNQQDISKEDIFSIEDILKGKGRINEKMRQTLQIYKAKGKEVPEEIIRPGLVKELDRWQYPLHFLDFEAGNYAVPVRSGRSPYHLVIFQFSCHTLQEDGSWSHHQWIDDFESGYVNYELIRQLKKVPGITEGTIVQYSNFERHALKTIRRELMEERDKIDDADELILWIEKIIRRRDSSHHQAPFMADLSRQVKHFYYNREMENSLSVKDVLRSVMSHSEFLKQKYSKPYSSRNFDGIIWWQPDGEHGARNPYELLTEKEAGAIRRGTEAMVVYGKLLSQKLPEDELKHYRQSLLRYCELDTLAMVMIYQHWQQEVKRIR
ncbi:MAG TPA: DUF2779 domain-containing protein [Balneolaceae bacterium]